jgi:hypothetical protein
LPKPTACQPLTVIGIASGITVSATIWHTASARSMTASWVHYVSVMSALSSYCVCIISAKPLYHVSISYSIDSARIRVGSTW